MATVGHHLVVRLTGTPASSGPKAPQSLIPGHPFYQSKASKFPGYLSSGSTEAFVHVPSRTLADAGFPQEPTIVNEHLQIRVLAGTGSGLAHIFPRFEEQRGAACAVRSPTPGPQQPRRLRQPGLPGISSWQITWVTRSCSVGARFSSSFQSCLQEE